MLFAFKYKHYDYRHLKSGQVRKLLSAMKYPIKGQKTLIAKAINAYREGRPHYAVSNIPHICVEPGSVTMTKPQKQTCLNDLHIQLEPA